MKSEPTDTQLGEAWEAVSSALRYIGKASDDLVAGNLHEANAKIATGYIIEAAEALGLTVTEARQ